MLTQCPNCGAIYRVYASELSSARGFVECGDCREQFNALDRIADEPTFAAATETETAGTVDETATFVLLDGDHGAAAPGRDDPRLSDAGLEDAPTEDGWNRAGSVRPFDQPVPGGNQTLPPEDHAILFTEPDSDELNTLDQPGQADPQPATVTVSSSDELDIDDVPAILHEEVAAMTVPPARRSGWLWAAFAVVLIVVLAAQLGWHYRNALVERAPSLQIYVDKICELIGCEFEPAAGPDAIQLLSRDVREHPRYENALLVNATLINKQDHTVPFPDIQLGLFDNTGTPIGVRRFEPGEYLDKSIDRHNGLPAGKSVHVVLEVALRDDRAVSFEFAFF